jgi:AraC-like DNA-binding protein
MEIRKGNIFLAITEFERKLPIYLDRIGRWRNQNAIKRERGYRDFQWLQCTGGRGVLKLGDKVHSIEKSQGMLLYPDEPHEYYADVEPWEVHWLAFNGSCAHDILRTLDFSGSRILTFATPDPVLQRLYQISITADSPEPINSLKSSSLVYQLLLDLYRYGAETSVRSRQQYFEQLSPAIRYIEANYATPLTLEQLAGELSVSPQYTCTLFQNALGLRPFEYLTKIRLRKAKELLIRNRDLDIGEVAREVGYEHTSYFIKLFKRHEGVTPLHFRRKA